MLVILLVIKQISHLFELDRAVSNVLATIEGHRCKERPIPQVMSILETLHIEIYIVYALKIISGYYYTESIVGRLSLNL